MGLQISDKELTAVSALDGNRRYEYFVKRVADWQEAWGLYDEGWLTMRDDDGQTLLPLWPARRYAEAHPLPQWGAFAEPRSIPLPELLDDWLPGLTADERALAIFPVASSGESLHPSPAQLEADLRRELSKFAEDGD